MKVGIIGTGKMGRGFAEALSTSHEVTVGSRDPERARTVAERTGASGGATYLDAAANADVVILTVPWSAMDDTLAELGDVSDTPSSWTSPTRTTSVSERPSRAVRPPS